MPPRVLRLWLVRALSRTLLLHSDLYFQVLNGILKAKRAQACSSQAADLLVAWLGFHRSDLGCFP